LSVIPRHGYNFVPADHPLLLLLADIAAEHDVPIDLHMDTLIKSIATPAAFSRNQNPKTLPETLAAFRRLLEHNPKAKIVWAHGGSDHLGDMTAELVGAPDGPLSESLYVVASGAGMGPAREQVVRAEKN
jgi:hypothetical protein